MENQQITKIIKWSVGSLFALILIFSCFGTIHAGERGVKTKFGAVKGVIDTGLYFKLPFVEHVTSMSVKTLTVQFDKDSSLSAASSDLQDVKIGTVVNYHIDASKVDKIFQQYSSVENYQGNVIEPTIRETAKSIAAQYSAEELVTKRAEVSDKISTALIDKFTTKDAVMEKFSITNFEFSTAFTQAIEAKVTATQNAEAAKNKLEQVKFEAAQTVATAEAQAKAIQIQAQAINSQGGADYVSLQAIKQWNGVLPIQMVPGGSVPFLNVNAK